jgi:glycine cleavage system H lipoate-binding protein
VLLKIGLTHAFLDELGDVSRIRWSEGLAGRRVDAGARLATLDHSSLTRSESDELYHARWGHDAGEFALESPFPADVVEVNSHILPKQLDEGEAEGRGAWLVRLRVPREAWAAWARRDEPGSGAAGTS